MRTIALPFVRREAPARWIDLTALGIAGLFVAWFAFDVVTLLPNLDPSKIAVDYNLYVGATRRWLSGGFYYLPHQLAGPYETDPGVILYPPPFTLVMLPFVVLPWIAYWAAPIAAVAYAAWRHRPRVIAWPGIALCLWFPGTTVMVVAGNPTMLIVGALALATVWYWPGVLVLLKPSLAPFALFGVWQRSWWVALVVFGLVSLPFLGMWVDYAHVLLNARQPLGLLYNLGQVPTMLLPIIIWAGRRQPAPPSREPTA